MVLTPHIAQEIADTITEAIGHNVIVTDHEGRVIGSGDPSRVGTLHGASVEVVKRRAEAWHDNEAARRLVGVKAGMTLPLLLGREIVGTVGITGDPDTIRPFGEIVRRQTEIMLRETMLLRLDLLRERALEQLVRDIASYERGAVDAELLETRAVELGFRLDVPRAALIVAAAAPPRPRGPDDADVPDIGRQSLKLQVVRAVRDVFSAAQDLVAPVGMDAVAVLADLVPRGEGQDRVSALAAACQSAADDIGRRFGVKAWVGVGTEATSLTELPRSYHEAWSVLRLGRRLAPDRQVHHAHDFRIRELLVNVSPRQRARFRDALLEHLKSARGWPESRRTLVAWLENGFRLVDTANALHIHRNTLLYRLTRISETVGEDVRTPRVALGLYLACLVDDLEESSDPGGAGPAQH